MNSDQEAVKVLLHQLVRATVRIADEVGKIAEAMANQMDDVEIPDEDWVPGAYEYGKDDDLEDS
jgi:N6-adenosine-specific RNA methylase IME4